MSFLEDKQIIEEFVIESREHLGDIEQQLLAIEAAGEDINVDLVNTVFRAVHSIKGAAGFLGFSTLSKLAHDLESVLNLVRNRQLVPDAAITDVLLRSSDRLRTMLDDIENSNGVEIEEFCTALSAILNGTFHAEHAAPAASAAPAPVVSAAPAPVVPVETAPVVLSAPAHFAPDASAVPEVATARIAATVEPTSEAVVEPAYAPAAGSISGEAGGAPSSFVDYSPTTSNESYYQQMLDQAASQMETPSASASNESYNPLPYEPNPITPSLEPTMDKIMSDLETLNAPVASNGSNYSTPNSEYGETSPTQEKPAEPVAKAAPAGSSAGTPSPSGADAHIRVAVTVLDSLMNLAGELVLARNQLLQIVHSNDSSSLDNVASRLNQITSELQEAIMQTRMQTVGNVFNKFPRIVRDLSNKLGKQCELTVEGNEVELDKSIIELISDPLTHLVRNSVDHGIEMPQDRVRLGKPAKGTLVLRAFHQSGKVNITLIDDGKGIDGAKLKQSAIAKGIITPEQAREMSDREAIQLIFRPGFSMAQQVTEVSGRGVGMDVVKTNIEKLGGTVGIETQTGAGTTVHIKLPLTLAIIPSLVVRTSGRRFAIPQTSIRELVRVKASEIHSKIQHVKNAEVLRLRGSLLPLVRLDSVISGQKQMISGDTALNIVVVETGRLNYGLVVDGLHDSEEIVIKPLGRHMQNCFCLSGATILGDGEVAMILDVSGIAKYAELSFSEEQETEHAEAAAVTSEERQVALLFTNHPSERFAVPMALISRLERIRTEQIDSVGGQEVLQYRGGSLPLLRLDHHLTAKPAPDSPTLHVLVYSVMRREVGLIVPQLVDIREVNTNVDTVTLREPGVIGSIIEEGKATRLLDLYELTQKAHSQWFIEQEPEKQEINRQKTILLAEDSGFFRAQLTTFLTDGGFQVVGAEDGQDAWDKLNDPANTIDLIVTDIEMPRMNGLELSRHAKDSPKYRHIPVIAVTSLASEEDMARGQLAGIDEYHIKLDRERLLDAVSRHIHDGVVGCKVTR